MVMRISGFFSFLFLVLRILFFVFLSLLDSSMPQDRCFSRYALKGCHDATCPLGLINAADSIRVPSYPTALRHKLYTLSLDPFTFRRFTNPFAPQWVIRYTEAGGAGGGGSEPPCCSPPPIGGRPSRGFDAIGTVIGLSLGIFMRSVSDSPLITFSTSALSRVS